MKILIYTHEFPPETGGAGRYSYEMAKALIRLGQEIIVLTTKRGSKDITFDKKEIFRIIRMPRPRGNKERFIGLCFFILTILKYRPGQVLITDKWAQEVCSLASLFFPFKYYLTIHGSEVLINTTGTGLKAILRKWLFNRLCSKSKKIIAVSKYTRQLLTDTEIYHNKIYVIYNGVDIKRFSQRENSFIVRELKRKLHIDDNEKVLLTVSVLKPRKGHDMVIKVLPSVLKRVSCVKYIIIGDGEDRERLQRLVRTLSLNKYVIFTGYVSDEQILDYYDLCDVFIMPSRQDGNWVEGFGISFLEANARGKPVIGGRHGGVPEVIVDGKTGILVNPNNPENIAQAVIKLLSEEKLAKKMGQKGRERCFASFTWDQIALKTLNLLEK